MLEALEEQQRTPSVQALSFEERIALLVDRERLRRENHRRMRLLRGARLKVAEASIEDINYKAARGLDKRQIATLATGEWIRRAQNLLITGATGSGKTWIACALAQQACGALFGFAQENQDIHARDVPCVSFRPGHRSSSADYNPMHFIMRRAEE